MANIVRAALLQAAWTGDRESMVEKGAHYAYEAADRGARVMCFQELFNGPYFCQVQDDDHKDTAEAVPDGFSTQRMIEVARETEDGPRGPPVREGGRRVPVQHRRRDRRGRHLPR